MDLPLCKICGDRHRLGGCPKFLAPAEQRRAWLQGMTNAPKTTAAPKAVEHRQAKEAPKSQAPEVKPKFDKKAYQRELMRKRRAACKQTSKPN